MPTDWRAEEAERVRRKAGLAEPLATFRLGPNTRRWIEARIGSAHEGSVKVAASDAMAQRAKELAG